MPKNCSLSIASLILGIFSLFFGSLPILILTTSLFALILGVVGLITISKNKDLKGKEWSYVGIFLAILGLIIFMGSTSDSISDKEMKPPITKTEQSVASCKQNWVCSDWTECSLEEKKTRRCQDNNQCNITYNKPSTTKSCTPSLQTIKENAIRVSYDNLYRFNEEYVGKIVFLKGGVYSVQEYSPKQFDLLVGMKKNTFGFREDLINIDSYKGIRLRENDEVFIWGEVKGLENVEWVSRGSTQMPSIEIFDLKLKKQCNSNISCFETAITECNPAELKIIPSWSWEIIDEESNNCKVKVNVEGQGDFEISVPMETICYINKNVKLEANSSEEIVSILSDNLDNCEKWTYELFGQKHILENS